MIDRIGMIFGRLAIKSVAPESHSKNIKYICTCSCGNEKTIGYKNMRCGSTKSCGCLAKENMERLLKSGEQTKAKKLAAKKLKIESTPKVVGDHPLASTWRGMLKRCYYPKHDAFVNYGAKGVIVCDRWKQDFYKFVEDMGDKPTKEHSLDRINPFGNYEPNNCRWANRYEQATNKKKYNFVPRASLKGRTLMCSRWAKLLDINLESIKTDISKGYSPEIAVVATKLRKQLWKKNTGVVSTSEYFDCYEKAKQYLNTLDKP